MSRNVRRSHSVRGIFAALIVSVAALAPSTDAGMMARRADLFRARRFVGRRLP